MKRNLKALGLALVAAFAMSVVAASAAQAESLFTQPQNDYPVAITGHEHEEAINRFTVPGGSTECDNVTFEGTLEEASTSLTVTPHYTECESSGVNSAVDLNGCDYVFTAGAVTSPTDVHGSVHVQCPTGKSITLTIPESGSLCVVHIPPQTAGGITYTNNPGGDSGAGVDDVTVDINAEVDVNITSESIFCPLSGGEAKGTYESQVTVTGYKDLGTHHWITKDVNGTETTLKTVTEGEQIDIDVGTE